MLSLSSSFHLAVKQAVSQVQEFLMHMITLMSALGNRPSTSCKHRKRVSRCFSFLRFSFLFFSSSSFFDSGPGALPWRREWPERVVSCRCDSYGFYENRAGQVSLKFGILGTTDCRQNPSARGCDRCRGSRSAKLWRARSRLYRIQMIIIIVVLVLLHHSHHLSFLRKNNET